MTGLAAAALALAAVAPRGSVTVRVLEKHRPGSAEVSRPGERHLVAAVEGGLRQDGAPVAAPLRYPAGRWLLEVPGAGRRSYRGAPAFGVEAGRLAIVVRMAVEDYVAAAVASETVPGTPFEALKAQAVVARSYALAARGRHQDADLCDLAHCQVLGGPAPGAHRIAAEAAARETAGQVLRLASGLVAEAPFHAACGGHTGDPRELFGGDATGAAAVPDEGCPPRPWSAEIPSIVVEAVVGRRLAGDGAPAARWGDLELRYGEGGFLVQVALGKRVLGGEAFARALDGAMGYGVVRSSRFRARPAGDAVELSGTGIGHGVGLCQAGAARRAAAGEGYRDILARYFPLARLSGR